MASPKSEGQVSDPPVPVIIAEEQHPIPVVVEAVVPNPAKTVTAGKGTVLEPTTTEQEDIVTAGQRRVNLVWEITQALIAVAITFAIIYTAVIGVVNETLANAFFLIVGFYFSRTNHTAIGGVGKKPRETAYVGR